MTLPTILPSPKRIRMHAGRFTLPASGWITLPAADWIDATTTLTPALPRFNVAIHAPGCEPAIRLRLNTKLPPDGYQLEISPDGIRLDAPSPSGAFNGAQTLRQIIDASPNRLQRLHILDWPDLPVRGVYYDVTRGRVPKLERLLELADRLAHYKINHLQLYMEHTFRFKAHPAIGRNADPLTREDILALDEFCARRFIELVPSLACFGHMSNVLALPQYRHLAEDWGIGRYVDPAVEKLLPWQRRQAWSLAPSNPETYTFLDSLFAELLPLFRSKQFNVCCDETWDLGMGQSHALCRRKGQGRLYLDHLLKLRRLAASYGKHIMFWGDIIRRHPALVAELPADIRVLDWGYTSDHPFARIADFRKANVPFYACPGTSSWVSLFPRIHESSANIRAFTTAAMREKATGLLNTDWGDGGHYNFMEYSWYGYLFGAEQGWNNQSNPDTFPERFCRRFLRCDTAEIRRAIRTLGDIAHLNVAGRYQSTWTHIFFATPEDDLFKTAPRKGSTSKQGQIHSNVTVTLSANLGAQTAVRLNKIRETFVHASRQPGIDPHGVLPYWIFAVDTLHHAARKLTVLAVDDRNTPSARRKLAGEMKALRKRFETLWLARNRRSEIRITLAKYDAAIAALQR